MKHVPTAAIALVLFACSADVTRSPQIPPADSPGAERPVEIDTYRHSIRLRHGDGLWFVNAHGDLRMRASGDGGVHYAAVIQKLDGERRDVSFGTDRRPGGFVFSVKPPENWVGRVDASARVPPTSALDLETDDGLIEVRAGDVDVVARTVSGPIHYRGGGTIQAHSDSGDMQISLSALDYDGSAGTLATGGAVELWLTPGSNVVVYAQSAGGNIVNNVSDPLSVAANRLADGSMTLILGRGNAELRVRAGGDIVIGAVPVPGQQ